MVRNLVLVLGDQLNRDASAFDGFDKKKDAVWMAEVREECDSRLESQMSHSHVSRGDAALSRLS